MNESHHRLALPQGTYIQDFQFDRVLGQGGFGITYLGWNIKLDIPVAIKEYLPYGLAIRDHDMSVVPQSSQVASDFAWGLDRFLDEAKTLAQFNHPNIVRVHHFFEAHSTAYIVMEYAEGETLSAFLQSRGALTEAELKGILYPILDGLEVVHGAEFLHRDIKPGNIIIRDEDDSPVLLDFGAARQAIGARSRSVTSIFTSGYTPIEQYSSRGDQGPWTDIYALGAVCYHALTGQVPEDSPKRVTQDTLMPAVEQCAGQASAGFLLAIDRALQVNGEDRPQSIADWRDALKKEKEPPPPPSPEEEKIGTDNGIDGRQEQDPKDNLRESPEATHRLNLCFRLGTSISLLAITLPFIVIILEGIFAISAHPILPVFLIFLLIIGLLCGGNILYKLWSLIPAGDARTTPGKAVGFLFVPFFNFIAIYGLAEALNSQMRRHGIKNKNISRWLCLSFCIFFTFSLLIFLCLIVLILMS